MEDKVKYAVIFQTDEITYCACLFDNFYTALGYIYKKFNEKIKFTLKNGYELINKTEFEEIDMDLGYIWKAHYKDKERDYEYTDYYYLLENIEENIMEERK